MREYVQCVECQFVLVLFATQSHENDEYIDIDTKYYKTDISARRSTSTMRQHPTDLSGRTRCQRNIVERKIIIVIVLK